MDSAQFSWGSSPLPGASWYTWPLSKAEKIQRCFELFGRELSELEDQVATNGNEILEVSDPDSFIRNNVAVEPMKEAVAAHLGVDPVDICLIRAICNYFTGATGLCLAEVDGVDYRKSFSNWCKGEMKSVESRRIFHCYAIPSSYWSHEASVQLLDEELNKLQGNCEKEGRLRMIYGDDPCIGVHLRQLLLDGDNLPSLTLDDFDNRVFAMEPSCHHNLWSKMTNRTWAIHHVSPEQIRCMWSADLAAAYYQESQEAEGLRVDEDRELNAFPDLCGCATDESFFERSDLDKLQAETNRILEDEEE